MAVDFLCIGAQKAATSWFHQVMSRHPQILASDPKELNYFTANYDRGALWYEGHFDGPREGRLLGECSPNYFCSMDAPIRAADYNPDFRLIAILRDPVARAFSNHLHEIRKEHIPEDTPFAEALRHNRTYLEQGRYRANLERWIGCFGRDRLLVLLAEDIAVDPWSAFSRVCDHLVISDRDPPASLTERTHESIAYHNGGVQRLLRAGGDVLRKTGLGGTLKAVKNAPGIRQVLEMNKRDLRLAIPRLPPEIRAELAEEFREDMLFVADLIEKRTLPWESWTTVFGDDLPNRAAHASGDAKHPEPDTPRQTVGVRAG